MASAENHTKTGATATNVEMGENVTDQTKTAATDVQTQENVKKQTEIVHDLQKKDKIFSDRFGDPRISTASWKLKRHGGAL